MGGSRGTKIGPHGPGTTLVSPEKFPGWNGLWKGIDGGKPGIDAAGGIEAVEAAGGIEAVEAVGPPLGPEVGDIPAAAICARVAAFMASSICRCCLKKALGGQMGRGGCWGRSRRRSRVYLRECVLKVE